MEKVKKENSNETFNQLKHDIKVEAITTATF